jgi:GDP-L-fucose synthase
MNFKGLNNLSPDASILITGAGGGLGKATISKLKARGHLKILTPTRQELDLLNAGAVMKYFSHHKPRVVLHFAAIVFGLQGNIDNQMLSLSENTRIQDNLFFAINLYPVDYVFFAGSVASYPYPYKSIPLSEVDFFGGTPHFGEFGYAMSKRHAYSYLKILKEVRGVDFTYGIFTNLYGEYDRFDSVSGHVIPSLISRAYQVSQAGGELSVWGDGSAQRDFLHFDDAAAALVLCMNSNQDVELANISSGEATSIKTLAGLVCKAAGLGDATFLVDKPVGVQSRVVDDSIISSLGFKKATDLETGIPRLYNWYAENIGNVRV